MCMNQPKIVYKKKKKRNGHSLYLRQWSSLISNTSLFSLESYGPHSGLGSTTGLVTLTRSVNSSELPPPPL